jgi:putative glycerol-1-phosphate prenyltransferase
MKILKSLTSRKKKGVKSLAVLVDPDRNKDAYDLEKLVATCKAFKVDYIFIGGSLLIHGSLSETIKYVKDRSSIPIVLFPGSNLHIDKSADAILFLSLISGRNPEFLIGQHVAAATIIKKANIEHLSTGYILVGSDISTTVAHISQTFPIPSNKPEIAVCTAMAGEMLGMSMIYLDAGSGARESVPPRMIDQIRKSISVPLIVGGGIDTNRKARSAYEAGADTLVLGNAVEKNLNFIKEVAEIRDELNIKHS